MAHALQGRRLSPQAAPRLVRAPSTAPWRWVGAHTPGTLKATASHFAAVPALPSIANQRSLTPRSRRVLKCFLTTASFELIKQQHEKRHRVSTAPTKTPQLRAFSPEHPSHGLAWSSSSCQGRTGPCTIQPRWTKAITSLPGPLNQSREQF